MPTQPPTTHSVLFVCLGNICRSPTAHGVLAHLARERGVGDRLRIESCGTGSWHVGELPDSRTRATALRNGVRLTSRARAIDPSRDFAELPTGFGLVLAMDRRNHRDLLRLGCPRERLALFRAFDPVSCVDAADWGVGSTASVVKAHADERAEELDVPDPYGDGPGEDGEGGPLFQEVYAIVHRTANNLLDRLFPESANAPRR